MNLLKLDKSGSWFYKLTISPITPADTVRLERLVHTHSEYCSKFDTFIDDELIGLIVGHMQEDKSIFSYLHVTNEILLGHTSVTYFLNFIFGHGIKIHNFSDEFFEKFEELIENYFKEYNIVVIGK